MHFVDRVSEVSTNPARLPSPRVMKTTLRVLPFALALTAGAASAQRYVITEPGLPQPKVHFIDLSFGVHFEYDVFPLTGIPSGFWGAPPSVADIARAGNELWVMHPQPNSSTPNVLSRFDLGTAAPLGSILLAEFTGMTHLATVADGVWIGGTSRLQKRSFSGALVTEIRVPGILDVITDGSELLALRGAQGPAPQSVERFDISGNRLGSIALAVPGNASFAAVSLHVRGSNGNFLLAGVGAIHECDRATGALVQTLNLSQLETEALELPDGRLLSINASGCTIVDRSGQFATASPVPTTEGRYLFGLAPFDAGGPVGRRFCPAGPNSSGQSAAIAMRGTTRVADGTLVLDVLGGPPQAPGLVVYGAATGALPIGNGTLCVGGAAGLVRTATLGAFDAFGQRSNVALVYANLPANAAVVAGSAWSFQYVFRDVTPAGATVDLSDALELRFD